MTNNDIAIYYLEESDVKILLAGARRGFKQMTYLLAFLLFVLAAIFVGLGYNNVILKQDLTKGSHQFQDSSDTTCQSHV